MTEALRLTPTLNMSVLPVASQPRLVYLLLEVRGGAEGDVLPVNLALVVDISESMHVHLASEAQFKELARRGGLREVMVDGVPVWESPDIPAQVLSHLPRRVDLVEDALRAAVEHLRPADRFSLVAFAGQAVTLVPNTAGDQKRRLLEAMDGLDELRLGDDTYIARGIALGFEELQRGSAPGRADRLLVLTDGFAFDEAECRAWVSRARQARVPISTMGLGGEFNEELMIPIADQTGGEAYLLESPDDVPAAFARELQRAQTVRYRNLELKLAPSPGVEVRSAHRVCPSIAALEVVNEGGSYSFPLGDLTAGEEPALLVELLVPPRPAGVYRLAQALLAAEDRAGGVLDAKVRADVVAEYTADPARAGQQTPEVLRVVEAVTVYKLQRRAQADLSTGDIAGATRRLRAAATRLLDMGEVELAEAMERQARDLEQHGQADPQQTKKLRYETRKLGAQIQ